MSILIFSFKQFLIGCLLLLLAGCNNVFLQPNRVQYSTPDQFDIPYEDVTIRPANIAMKQLKEPSVALHAWLLNPEALSDKPNILFFHGNAQNISSHIGSVLWLAELGYPIFLVDYRGYGKSTGDEDLDGAIIDIQKATKWFLRHYHTDQPVYVFGQSLGASMGIAAFALNEALDQQIAGYIFEAGFASYRKIVRDVLSRSWIMTWVKYPLSGLVHDRYEPQQLIARLTQPILLIHSTEDEVIPYEHSQLLQQSSSRVQALVTIDGAHIRSRDSMYARQAIIDFLSQKPDR